MTNPIQSVLVATDFSDASLNALRTAAGICKRQGATLRILHVVSNFDVALPPLGHYAMVGQMIADMQTDVGAQLAELAAKTGSEWNIVCTANEATGPVPEAIVRYAAEHDCDLIVMGTHGVPSPVQRLFFGSNALAVLKRTSIPVLAVPEKASADAFRSILFPVRAVDGATDKYDVLRPIVERNGATVHVAAVAAMGNPDRFMHVNELTSELTDTLSAEGVRFSVEKHYCADVADTILHLAEEKSADLLVITSTLEKEFWQLFSGPFSRKVIDGASTAVLLVRPLKNTAAEAVAAGATATA